jgi:hypothetical protein
MDVASEGRQVGCQVIGTGSLADVREIANAKAKQLRSPQVV